MATQKTECDDDVPNNQSLEKFILKIHTELDKYYKSQIIYIWSSFDWLNGLHIFTEFQSSEALNDIKECIISLKQERVPIIEMYNQLLPWNLNLKTLVDFKTLTDKYFLDKLLGFIWRQVRIIIYYFEYTPVANISNEIFRRLNVSTKWYYTGTSELNNILFLTEETSRVINTMASLIQMLETVSVTAIDHFLKAVNNIQNSYEGMGNNVDMSLNINGTNFAIQLNQTFLNNCYDALNYINNYIWIINKSKVLNNNLDTYNLDENCKTDSLDHVFTENQLSSSVSAVNIPTEDEGDNTQSKRKRED
jgi:hypothetical protein